MKKRWVLDEREIRQKKRKTDRKKNFWPLSESLTRFTKEGIYRTNNKASLWIGQDFDIETLTIHNT